MDNLALVRQALNLATVYRGARLLIICTSRVDLTSALIDLELLERLGIDVVIGRQRNDEASQEEIVGFPATTHTFDDMQSFVCEMAGTGVTKLCILTDIDCLRHHQARLDFVSVAAAEQMLSSEPLTPFARYMLQTGVTAAAHGIPRTHIINGNRPSAIIMELFTDHGAGTMVYTDTFRSIRPAREDDTPVIARLRGVRVARPGRMVPHSGTQIVLTIDGTVHAYCRYESQPGLLVLSEMVASMELDHQTLVRELLEYLLESARQQHVTLVLPVERIDPLLTIVPWFSERFERQTIEVSGRRKTCFVSS